MPLMSAIDSSMVMGRLQDTGWTYEQSKALWGRLSGYCNPLIGMPQVFVQAIAMSLVPAISAGFKVKDLAEVSDNMKFSMRSAMIIGFPCAVGIFSLAHPILMLLYRSPDRAAEVAAAVPTLQFMCLTVIFMSTLQTLTGILQGVDKQMVPVKNLAIGAVGKILVTYIFVGIKAVNVNGATLGTVTAYLIATILNMRDIKKYTGVTFDFNMTFVKPFIASVIMGVCAFASYKLLFLVTASNDVSTILAIAIAVAVYGVLILGLKAITKKEIAKLPKGDKLVGILDKFIK